MIKGLLKEKIIEKLLQFHAENYPLGTPTIINGTETKMADQILTLIRERLMKKLPKEIETSDVDKLDYAFGVNDTLSEVKKIIKEELT